MTIWVDADACPRSVREILYRAAERRQVPVTLVANQAIDIPRSRHIRMLQVARGFDVADNEIATRVSAGDLNHKVRLKDPHIVGTLAEAFNQMAASLKQSRKALKNTYLELAEKEKMKDKVNKIIAHKCNVFINR